MRQFDSNGLILCKIQARLFVDSLAEFDCSSAYFIRCFMNSSFASRMDAPGFLGSFEDETTILRDMKNQYSTNRGNKKFSEEEMYWIGYLLRYWCYTREVASSSIYKIIQSKGLRDIYAPYHTMDCSVAIERILEAKGIKEEKPAPMAIMAKYLGPSLVHTKTELPPTK